MEQSDLITLIVKCFESLKIPYFITGSIASMAYGEPRLTNDIDVIADIALNHTAGIKKWFPEPDFYLSEDDIKDAIKRRRQFNIIHPASGLKIDIIIKENTPFDASRFKRIVKLQPIKDITASFSSPEDIIIKKMDFYNQGGSEKHLRDIASILKISGDSLDLKYIEEWADNLKLRDIWETVLKRIKHNF
jgi:hypothetical protein